MMLAQLCVLGFIGIIKAQNDNHSYEDGGYNSYENEGRPDFSKYYSVDNAPPSRLVQNGRDANIGFINPIEFSTVFGPSGSNLKTLDVEQLRDAPSNKGFVSDKDFKGFSEYGAEDFGVQDYFELAQKQQKADRERNDPTPTINYSSHFSPNPKLGYEQNSKSPTTYNENQSETDEPEESRSDDTENKFIDSSGNNYSNFRASPQIETTNYQQHRQQVPTYSTKYTKTETPYQKYSFQPTAGSHEAPIIESHSYYPKTDSNANEYQASETAPQSEKNNNCVKITKMVSGDKLEKKPMSCFVCKDSKTGGKSERCAYNSEPSPKSYYHTTSKSYGSPESYRHKREETSYSNPYEEIKSNSHSYRYKPKDFDKDFYKAPDFSQFSSSYDYVSKPNKDNQNEQKSDSEVESEELVKDSKNCRKTLKNGVTCMICKNPKTGTNYEQCSYESQPTEKKYAYVKEKNYNSNDDPVDETEDENAESENQESKDDQPEKPTRVSLYNTNTPALDKSTTNRRRLEKLKYVQPQHKELQQEEQESKYVNEDDHFHAKLFPQLVDEESRRESQTAPPDSTQFEETSGKQDVEKVLEEFVKKDRSNCKQLKKKDMTCYLCIDDKGIKNEECMYVSESVPQSSHVAYHKVQRVQNEEAAENDPEEHVPIIKEHKRKRFVAKRKLQNGSPLKAHAFGEKLAKDETAA